MGHISNQNLRPTMELSNVNRIRRALCAYALAEKGQVEKYVDSHYAWDAVRTKNAVGAITGGDLNNATSESHEYVREIVKTSFLGPMLPHMLQVGFLAPFHGAGVLDANWIGEFDPIPISKYSLETESLARRKVAALALFSKEALRQQHGEAQAGRAQDAAVRGSLEQQFIDPAATGFPGESPASVTSYAGVESITATGDPKASLRALTKDFSNLDSTFLIADPETWVQAHLTDSVFQDVGAKGGTVAGIPALASQHSPRDSNGGQIVLIDASRVVIALGQMIVERDDEGSIEMSDAFDSNGLGELVSLFTTESVALKTLIHANWKLMDTSACRILTEVDW